MGHEYKKRGSEGIELVIRAVAGHSERPSEYVSSMLDKCLLLYYLVLLFDEPSIFDFT